jgi:hypothetical protein
VTSPQLRSWPLFSNRCHCSPREPIAAPQRPHCELLGTGREERELLRTGRKRKGSGAFSCLCSHFSTFILPRFRSGQCDREHKSSDWAHVKPGRRRMGGLPSGATPPSQRGQGPTYVPARLAAALSGALGPCQGYDFASLWANSGHGAIFGALRSVAIDPACVKTRR